MLAWLVLIAVVDLVMVDFTLLIGSSDFFTNLLGQELPNTYTAN